MFDMKSVDNFASSDQCNDEATTVVARLCVELGISSSELNALFKNDKSSDLIIRLSRALVISSAHVAMAESKNKKLLTDNESLRSTVAMLSDL